MAHGYTHRTTRTGDVVTKVYQGPDAKACCAREAAALTAVAGLLPDHALVVTGASGQAAVGRCQQAAMALAICIRSDTLAA